jgi:protein-S-isoprenylcysteine O-methyltransferase Ste14
MKPYGTWGSNCSNQDTRSNKTGVTGYNAFIMAIEIKRPKEDRGQNWVIAQVFLLILYLCTPPYFKYFRWEQGMHACGILMMGWGLMFFVGGIVTLAKHHGWRNVTPFPKPRPGLPLVTDGAFAYVRHPMYLGGLLIAGGWSYTHDNVPQLILTVLLVVFFAAKTKREEAFLEKIFPDYSAYAAKVKRLIPGIY